MADHTANEKGLEAASNQAPEITTTNGFDSDRADEGRKTFDTLRARLALIGGMGLYELSDGTYLVSRAAQCRALPDLRAVAAFARAVSGGA
jgi:hypothetical protein